MDHRDQESTTGKEAAAIILSSTVPPAQVTDQRQDSWDVHKPLSPAVEKFTSGQAHIQRTIDKYINEASLMTEKSDLQGKIILDQYFI